VLLVGLTGGIGSGKSTAAALLGDRGAVVIDADELARRAVEPGAPGLARVTERFGPGVLLEDGGLDRAAMARIVFEDPEARRALEAIVHPEVARLFMEAVEPYRETDRVVVYVVPLLVENHLEAMFDLVVVVTAPEDVRIARVIRDRGLTEDEARARVAAQLTDEERLRVADENLDNAGPPEALASAVDELWTRLARRAHA
jgi:dephospho-CoA kinase